MALALILLPVRGATTLQEDRRVRYPAHLRLIVIVLAGICGGRRAHRLRHERVLWAKPLRNYTLTVTAASGTLTHTTSLQLNVQ